jgi:hypothetical protein
MIESESVAITLPVSSHLEFHEAVREPQLWTEEELTKV